MTAKIYLDYNVFTFYFDNSRKGIREKINYLKSNYILPYSPAHIEEVATFLPKPWAKENMEFIDTLPKLYEKLKSISEITDNNEFLPSINGGSIRHLIENPQHCFLRVIKDYNINDEVEPLEKERLMAFKALDPEDKISKFISSLPEDFLSNSVHGNELRMRLYFNSDPSVRLLLGIQARKDGIREYRWPDLCKSFDLLSNAMEITMNYLEEIRYRPEKTKKNRPRSRMHDVTHTIYATAADFFVSEDKKSIAKAKIAYNYFGIPTKVIHLDEIMEVDDLDVIFKNKNYVEQ